MPETISASAFAEIFLNDIPLLDVRAPLEFGHGAFPAAVNIPLLEDDERHAVGCHYKEHGKQAAIELGQQLVSGSSRQQRLQRWLAFFKQQPEALLYCYRGGLRSRTVQDWLQEAGCSVRRIEGGYKALRRYLMGVTEQCSATSEFLIVAGKTGSGKTHLIQQLRRSLDLEGFAKHRGSAFGKRITPQPSQIDFENNLAIAFLRLVSQDSDGKASRIFLEDESRSIGSLSLPLCLHEAMKESDIAMVEESLESRIEIILNDYIISNYEDFLAEKPAQAYELFAEFLLTSLERIKKRLGSENYGKIKKQMALALQEQGENGDSSRHRDWISILLTDYYDPMYDYQMGKKLQRVVYRGSSEEFIHWSSHINASTA